jgi:hypothetical protein
MRANIFYGDIDGPEVSRCSEMTVVNSLKSARVTLAVSLNRVQLIMVGKLISG